MNVVDVAFLLTQPLAIFRHHVIPNTVFLAYNKTSQTSDGNPYFSLSSIIRSRYAGYYTDLFSTQKKCELARHGCAVITQRDY